MKDKIQNMIKNRIEFLEKQLIVYYNNKIKKLEINSRIAELQELDIEIIKESATKR